MGDLRWRCQKPKVFTLVLMAAYAGASSIASLVVSVRLRRRFADLRLNAFGDPEKAFLEDCARDFEGLPADDEKYRARRDKCAGEFKSTPRYHWLPVIRHLVDQNVCDQADLCVDGDPGPCADRGQLGESGYAAGEVTLCYSILDKSRHPSKTSAEAAALRDQFAQECETKNRWSGYERKVQLEYCMWKHRSSAGVCTSKSRTICPEDNSCCPYPQSYTNSGGETVKTGEQLYTCQRSPVLGIYCQHSDFTAPAPGGGPCTELSCPKSFQWCVELADLSGLCLGEPCQDYHHALGYATTLVGCAALGLFLDLADTAVWICYPKAALPKAAAGFLSAAAKLTGLALMVVSGIADFVDAVVAKGCFNAAGNDMLNEEMQDLFKAFYFAACSAVVASLCLALLSALWVGNFSELPYARMMHRA